MPSPTLASFDDDQLLISAQAGNPATRDALLSRYYRLLRALVRKFCPHRSACQPDFVDDVINETFRMSIDPEITRFDPNRGNAGSYFTGLVRNAIRIISRQRKAVCEDCNVGADVPVPEESEENPKLRARNRRKAPVVYHNSMAGRSIVMPESTVEDHEQISRIFSGDDPEAEALVRAHYIRGEGLVKIASDYGVSHTTISRNIRQFLAIRGRQLALAGAA